MGVEYRDLCGLVLSLMKFYCLRMDILLKFDPFWVQLEGYRQFVD